MQVWLQGILLALWLWPQLVIWLGFETSATRLFEAWQEDYEWLACARVEALDRNLEAARAFLSRRRPDPTYGEALREATSEMQGLWAEVRAEVCSAKALAGFSLYQQANPELAVDYPNWWVRWQPPPAQEGELDEP